MSAAARRWVLPGGTMLMAPALVYLCLVYLAPLAFLLARSFVVDGALSLAPYTDLLSDPFTWQVIGNTLRVAALTTLLALAIGYPTAIALSRARGWLQIALLVSIVLPLSVGIVVKAFAWQIVLSRNGIVGQILVGSGLFENAPQLLFTQTGLIIGAANVFLPFMILPIYSVLNLMDDRLPEAAATLGASPVYRFTRVTLPLTLPGIVAGCAFVFSMSVSMYVIPSLLIGDRFQTLATLTGRSFLFMRNEQLGSTTAVLLLTISVAIILAASALARRVGGVR